MQSLADILATIERCSGITFADHESILLFDAQSGSFITDLVNAQGDHLWNAIHIDTGRLTKNVSYEAGQGLFYDSVVFFTNETRDCTIVHLPEVGVAIQFAMHRDGMLANESDASQFPQYQYYLDWAKHGGEANSPWTRFVNEWEALPTRFV